MLKSSKSTTITNQSYLSSRFQISQNSQRNLANSKTNIVNILMTRIENLVDKIEMTTNLVQVPWLNKKRIDFFLKSWEPYILSLVTIRICKPYCTKLLYNKIIYIRVELLLVTIARNAQVWIHLNIKKYWKNYSYST